MEIISVSLDRREVGEERSVVDTWLYGQVMVVSGLDGWMDYHSQNLGSRFGPLNQVF